MAHMTLTRGSIGNKKRALAERVRSLSMSTNPKDFDTG